MSHTMHIGFSDRYHNHTMSVLGQSEPSGFLDPLEDNMVYLVPYNEKNHHTLIRTSGNSRGEFHVQEECVKRFYDWLRKI